MRDSEIGPRLALMTHSDEVDPIQETAISEPRNRTVKRMASGMRGKKSELRTRNLEYVL